MAARKRSDKSGEWMKQQLKNLGLNFEGFSYKIGVTSSAVGSWSMQEEIPLYVENFINLLSDKAEKEEEISNESNSYVSTEKMRSLFNSMSGTMSPESRFVVYTFLKNIDAERKLKKTQELVLEGLK